MTLCMGCCVHFYKFGTKNFVFVKSPVGVHLERLYIVIYVAWRKYIKLCQIHARMVIVTSTD